MSPHLQVWRFHVTMLVSILHRGAGIILYASLIALAAMLTAIAMGPAAYDALIGWAPFWLIQTKILAFTAALAFHFGNGIRHLFWDAGTGFQPATANLTAWLVILFTFAAPAALFIYINFVR
ncbi:MAG: succinate dehydrogenase, cytochrome b556 subunit [Caulobacterales bacterium]